METVARTPTARRSVATEATADHEAHDSISVVIPVFNEEGSLQALHDALTATLSGLARPYEIIFVDDGSSDDAPRILEELAAADPAVGLIGFRRNFGKAAALDAGFQAARGNVVFTMDADLQDDPKEIPRLLAKLDEGYDLVSGWKKVRHDPLGKTLPSRVFNRVVSRVSGLRLHDFNCGFKAYRADVLKDIRLYGELHRFVPVLAHWNGFRVTEIPVQHHPRKFGRSKFGAGRFLKGFFDLLTVLLTTKFRSRPLHFFGYVAMVVGGLGALGLGYLFVQSMMGVDELRPRPLLYVSMLCIVAALQLLSTGLIGELMKSFQQNDGKDYQIRLTRLSVRCGPTLDAAGERAPRAGD